MGQEQVSTFSENAGWKSLKYDPTSTAFVEGIKSMQVIFITAGCLQKIFKEISTERLHGILQNVSIAVFDEVHHANEGEHSFVFLAGVLSKIPHPIQLLGLSASPVSGSASITKLTDDLNELCAALGHAKIVAPLKHESSVRMIPDIQCDVKPSQEEALICEQVERLCNYLLNLSLEWAARQWLDHQTN